MAPMTLPPGFRFHPTDEELVAYYLDRKITGQSIDLDIIAEIDLYKYEPWDLPEKSYLPSKDMEWYFYSSRDRKYPNGSRTNRATMAGYWKATGKDRSVKSHKKSLGMKKTLVYYRGRAPHGIRTNWVMHEYRLIHSSSCPSSSSLNALKDSYALCRVFKKTALIIPKPKVDQKGDRRNGSKEWRNKTESQDEETKETDIEGIMEADDYIEESFSPYNNFYNNSSATSSISDLTQGRLLDEKEVTMDDYPNPSQTFTKFASSGHEANSNSSSFMDYSDLFQDLENFHGDNSNLHNDPNAYSPLNIEVFHPLNENYENIGYKKEDYTSTISTFEEILALCSCHDHSIPLPISY